MNQTTNSFPGTRNFLMIALCLVAMAPATSLGVESRTEEWKGRGYDKKFQASLMPGMTIMGTELGFGLMGSFAGQILQKGFFPDVSNQVYLEATLGPSFMSAGTGFQLSTHLRWDFHKNEIWTFYGLGGFGLDIVATNLSSQTAFHPRFGAGVFWHVFPQISFRGELSHEFIGVGVATMF